MNNHIYTFKIITNNETLYKGQTDDPNDGNTFKFYQICTYPSKKSTKQNILEGRIIFFNANGTYTTKKIYLPKKKLDDFISKLQTSSYRLYPMFDIDKVEVTKDLYHYASSNLLN